MGEVLLSTLGHKVGTGHAPLGCASGGVRALVSGSATASKAAFSRTLQALLSRTRSLWVLRSTFFKVKLTSSRNSRRGSNPGGGTKDSPHSSAARRSSATSDRVRLWPSMTEANTFGVVALAPPVPTRDTEGSPSSDDDGGGAGTVPPSPAGPWGSESPGPDTPYRGSRAVQTGFLFEAFLPLVTGMVGPDSAGSSLTVVTDRAIVVRAAYPYAHQAKVPGGSATPLLVMSARRLWATLILATHGLKAAFVFGFTLHHRDEF
ncbi:hypothetical protein EAG_14383 [Camponotus floridanus]|uniref:Uncharacterized protein n=1 Tax=Camponotus floridanus TaxID=104421 RepID=E2A6M4_CAMFO|nr:hypothetical protein EAG_14383 [Camponotus floridanus]